MRAKQAALLAVLMMLTGSMLALGQAGAEKDSGRTVDNDNTFATATALRSGMLVAGEVNDNDDPSDFYSIYVVSGQVITVDFTYTCSSNFIVMNVYDQDQNNLGQASSSFTLLLILNGTYYIEVQSIIGTDNYDLTVTANYPTTMVPGVAIQDTLDQTDPFHFNLYYRIWLDGNLSGTGKSEAVWVNMSEPQGTDFDLYAVDILNYQKSETYNLTWYGDPTERVTFAASYSGWYYIRANAFSGTGAITLTCSKFTVDSDGNNDHANGTRAKHNAVATGSVDQGWDHYDWYKYHVLAGDTLNVKVDRTSLTDIFNLSVYANNMTYIIGNWNVQNNQPVASASVTLPAALSETTYFVSVSAILAFRGGTTTDDTAYVPYKITFTSTNHWPEVLSPFDDITLNEDERTSVELPDHFRDIDEDTLAYNVSGNTNIAASYNASSNRLELVPAANWFGKETLTVTADDGFGGKPALTLNVTVNSVNDPPFVKKNLPDLRMLQGAVDATSIDLSKVFGDHDITYGDSLNYSVTDNGSILVDIQPNGKVALTDPISFFGQVSLKFIATDQDGTTATAPCNVTVQHVNQPPRVKNPPGNLSVDEDTTATLDMSKVFSDLDEDPITLIPSGMAKITVIVNPDTRIVTFKPAPNLSGFFEDIKFTAQDDKGYGDFFVTVRVTVVPVNDPPVMKSYSPTGEVTLTEMDSQEFSVTATDIEPWETLNNTWFLDGVDIGVADSTYILVTNYNSAGKHTLKVTVDDGELSVSRSWNITVLNKNRDPSDVKITSPKTGEVVMQGIELEFTGSAKDLDGDEITFSWLDGKTEISTEKSFTTRSLKPGTHNIVLEVSDGTGTTRSKQVTVTITANTSPKVLSVTPELGKRFTKGSKIAFSVTARDAEGDTLTYQWSESSVILSTQPIFTTSSLKEGTHLILLSIYDGYSYTNQTVAVEVYVPAPAPAMNSRTLLMIGGAIVVVAIAGAAAFMVMRKKKPGAPEAAALPPPVLNTPVAMSDSYNPAPAEYQEAQAGRPDNPAYQPAAAETPYDSSQYSPEAGISDQQPGVSGQQPSWADQAPPQQPPPGAAPPGGQPAPTGEGSAPATEPAPAEPAPEAEQK